MSTIQLTPKEKAKAKRLTTEFPYYAKHCLKIRTKEQQIAPLVLNDAQKVLQKAIDADIKRQGYVRIIILKGRQQGLSTFVEGYLYWLSSRSPALKTMVVAHEADATETLFQMTQRYHDYCPPFLKPSTKYRNRRELSFDELDSSYKLETAGGTAIGRSETITHLHASELAFWSPKFARENWHGLQQTVPNVPGTSIFIESTANGMSGVFYDLWRGAVEGKNGYTPVFVQWFLNSEYREPVKKPLDHTPVEKELIERYGLDDEQLQWRRKKIAEGGLDLFHQEYPCEPEEAFLTTGRPVFNPDVIDRLQRQAPEPIRRMALEGGTFEDNPRGELLVYRELSPKESYYIGADIAIGVRGRIVVEDDNTISSRKTRGGDYSVAQVLDGERRQVAVWRGHVDPAYFADVLYALGKYYNDAEICPENNGHGTLTCYRLSQELNYPNLFHVTEIDKITERETTRFGFSTNVKTKPMIIDQLRAKLRTDEIEIYDKTTLNEMRTYVVTETGAMEAEAGCFDDCVMALALSNHINEGSWKPAEMQEEWYVEPL